MKKIKILLLGIVSVFLLLGTAFAIEATPADREAIEKVCRQYLLDYDAASRFGGRVPGKKNGDHEMECHIKPSAGGN